MDLLSKNFNKKFSSMIENSGIEHVKDSVDELTKISKEIKDYRKEVKLCEGIKQRSLKIKDKLQIVKEQENKVQERSSKERKRNY